MSLLWKILLRDIVCTWISNWFISFYISKLATRHPGINIDVFILLQQIVIVKICCCNKTVIMITCNILNQWCRNILQFIPYNICDVLIIIQGKKKCIIPVLNMVFQSLRIVLLDNSEYFFPTSYYECIISTQL